MLTPLSPSARILRNPTTIWTKLETNIVLVDVKLAEYYKMNALGGFVWKAIEHASTLDSLVQVVLSQFRVEEAQCRLDLIAFLTQLQADGLVTLDDGGSSIPLSQ